MSLFSHYQTLDKPFPCGSDGFLHTNFKREWIYAIGRNRFALDNEQNILTWQREWSSLLDDEKKAAMGNIIKFLGNKKLDDSAQNLPGTQAGLQRVEPYLSVFTDKDALAWTTAFMSSDLTKRSAQDHEIATLGFAAHLLDWIRENRPSALKKCVAMLESWVPLTDSKLYKNDSAFPGALERLSYSMPNTALERTSAVACAISGQNALLAGLLNRPETNVSALFKHAQSMAANGPLFSVLSALDTRDQSGVFLTNTREFGKQMFAVYKKQTKIELQEEPKHRLTGEELRQRCEFLHKLVDLGVECSEASATLLKSNASQLSISRFFYFLGELSQPWNAKQHDDFSAYWDSHGGLYVSEDMFGTKENKHNVLNALAKLPVTWTQWFQMEYWDELKKSAAGLLDPRNRDGLSIEGHRWFHEHTPSLYEHWIRGLPANPALLNDPVVGEAAWKHTQAGAEQFLFDATLAWIKAPEVHYDLEHSHYPLAKLAWARYGIDLDASVKKAMLDTQCDYRSLAVEAISPGMGKNRWQALMCVVDAFKETGDARAHWSDQSLVQDAIRVCIGERLNPNRGPDLFIDNGPTLFT